MRIKLPENRSKSILLPAKQHREDPPTSLPETKAQAQQKRQPLLPGEATDTPSKHATANPDELSLLMRLHQFGWLTARQLAALCWPSANDPIQKSRNVLKRLKSKSLVLQKGLFDDNYAYVLSAASARLLRIEGFSTAKTGKDLLHGKRQSNALHRWVANEYLIRQILSGKHVWSEYEIQSFKGPFPNGERTWRTKIPDALVGRKQLDGLLSLDWCEVELSNRNSNDHKQLTSFIVNGLYQPTIEAQRMELESVILIYPIDSTKEGTCQHAYKRACRLINAINDELAQVLTDREESYAIRMKKHILKRIYITLFDVGTGPVLRHLDDKTVSFWDITGEDNKYHKRLIGYFINQSALSSE